MAKGRLTWVSHYEVWRNLELASFKPGSGWPNALKQAFGKRCFLQKHLEKFSEEQGLSLPIAARRLERERGDKSMDQIFKALHASAPGIIRRVKRRLLSPPSPGRRLFDHDDDEDQYEEERTTYNQPRLGLGYLSDNQPCPHLPLLIKCLPPLIFAPLLLLRL